jgi:3-oxoacyl-[acyl-carrier protein] reductase
MNHSSITDKVVVITGASRGIGRATACFLAAKEARVVLVARDTKALQEVADRIRRNQGHCTVLPGDVSREENVKNIINQTLNGYGRIDVLINNAGTGVYGPLTSVHLEDFERVIGTNLKGVFLCSKEVIPVMVSQGHGHLINLASQAGKYGFLNLAIYSASKFGVVGFSEALARELEPYNIRVSCLCPGYVRTDFLEVFPKTLLEEVVMAEPQDVANQIYRLIISSETGNKIVSLRGLIGRCYKWLTWKLV